MTHAESRAAAKERLEKYRSTPQTYMGSQFVGRAGELLVCLDFVCLGYAAAINDFPSSPTDVFAEIPNKILRIQVKTCEKPRMQHKADRTMRAARHFMGYNFKVTNETADLYAFVALDIRKVLYLPVVPKVKRVSVRKFHELAEGSLNRFLFAELL